MKKATNRIGIFRSDIQGAGGIETWLYNVAVKYGKTHDITVYYGSADSAQLDRLLHLVKCVEYTGQDIELDTAIWCYDFLGYETVKAGRTVHVVHADYRYGYNLDLGQKYVPEIDEIYAVSKRAAESAEKMFNEKVEVIYNLVLPEVEKRPIKLISATRLSTEKGLDRMKMLANQLDGMGVDYEWDIYTPTRNIENISSKVTLKEPIMDMHPLIKEADFLVQLSDTESFGYSIVEAMVLGTKLVVTDLPVLKELGVNDNNAIIVPLVEANYRMVVDKIVARGPYVPPYSDTDKLLGPPSDVEYHPHWVKNISDGDILVGDIWVEPEQVIIVQDWDKNNPMLKEIK